tara:strand:- start:111 stop:482 length:372 start_codon:yes stop_codon:yes gene_type:complete
MAKDRFGYGTEKVTEEEFKDALINEVAIMKMAKNDYEVLRNDPKLKEKGAATFKMNPNRSGLKTIKDYFMQNPEKAARMIQSDEEFWTNMRMHLFPEQEKNRWGMSQSEWDDRNKGFVSKLFS